MKKPKPKMQPIVIDKEGVARFRENGIVRDLLEAAKMGKKMDLNDITLRGYSKWERYQFWQLIGYSVGGYGDVFPGAKVVEKADKKVEALIAKLEKEKLS